MTESKKPRDIPLLLCIVCGAPVMPGNHHCAQCIDRGFGPCTACEGIPLEVEEDAS
jgi:hypothetical protein